MVLFQKWSFFQVFFLGNIGQENVFYDILERKKNWQIFHRFFHHFFLGNIGQENVFYDILERKNAFLGYENNKFKNSKN